MKLRWIDGVAIALGMASFGFTSWLRYRLQARSISDLWSWGFPFAFYESWGPCPEPGTCRTLSWPLLLLDLVMWITIVASIPLIYRRFSRKGHP